MSAADETSAPEETTAYEELLGEVRARKQELDAIPDGPRPREPGAPPHKRRKVMIDWHLQVNYIGVYLATITLLVVGVLALNFVFISVFQRARAIDQARPFAEHTDLVLLGTLNLVFIVLLIIGMAVYAIIQSHRVAGPALRFRRCIHQLHRRDYDFHLQLRRKDYLQDLAAQVNGLNNALKAKDVVIADAVLSLEAVAAEHPHLREPLAEVALSLSDVVLPIPAEPEPVA